VESFKCTNSWKSPTWSTLSLVFNFCNSSVNNPIFRISIVLFKNFNRSCWFRSYSWSGVQSFEFFLSQIREFIVSKIEIISLQFIVVLDKLVIWFEDSESVLVLIRSIRFSMELFPFLESFQKRISRKRIYLDELVFRSIVI